MTYPSVLEPSLYCNLTNTLQRPPLSWRHWSERPRSENLLRYNLLDLRRVDVHFHQLVVVSRILWFILRMSSQHGGFTDLPLVVTDQVVADYVLVRLLGVLLIPVPLPRDEVELGAHILVAAGLLLVFRGHDELVEQLLHRVAFSKLVILLILVLWH